MPTRAQFVVLFLTSLAVLALLLFVLEMLLGF